MKRLCRSRLDSSDIWHNRKFFQGGGELAGPALRLYSRCLICCTEEDLQCVEVVFAVLLF